MGRSSRPKPTHLAEKLRRIRDCLGLSQNEMLRRLGIDDQLFQGSVSGYELGTREPPLMVLLQYAKAANVYVEALIDDELDLPERLPAVRKSEGVRRDSGGKGGNKRAAGRRM
ncbi:MAG: helix-turn-helix transcriptional regulator [Pyrinomonadaceae bacterium]